MKLLKTIKDKDLVGNYETREASRAVLFDDKNLVPLLFVSKFNYHKLPGGGIKAGENKIEALRREVLEEAGCQVKVVGEVGEIKEYRSNFKLDQTSYCFFGKVVKKGKSSLEQGEIDQGFKLIWVTLDDAIRLVKNDKPENYEGKFIRERDLAFLNEARKLVKNK